MAIAPLQTAKSAPRPDRPRGPPARAIGAALAGVEAWLAGQRDRLAIWVPVMLGGGIAAWFLLPGRDAWAGWLALCAGVMTLGVAIGHQRWTGRVLIWAGGLAAAGMLLIWWRAEAVAAPVLVRPVTTEFTARVLAVEPRPAEARVRYRIAPVGRPDLPPMVRVSQRIADGEQVPAIVAGDVMALRARLMPPPRASLPGGYDFSRAAWFSRIGAVGTVLGEVRVARPAGSGEAGDAGLRRRLTAHVIASLDPAHGGIAAALATGDRGAISAEDEAAMRASGLTHLLSISGLHVTAMVGGVMLLAARLLALCQPLARRWAVWPIAAAFGAGAGIFYTWLAGAEVPTVRSIIAALLVLAALVMGREAVTLRLVAAGALVVLLLWPETLAGPSFQMSFAAVAAIVALYEWPALKTWLARRDEGALRRLGRGLTGLLLTGIAVEAALMPIVLFHFHQAGVYGALANIVAIPLTTFVIMPLEALAIAADAVGAGAPLWWMTGQAIAVLLALAHAVAGAPGALAHVPAGSPTGFGVMLAGLLWLLCWRGRTRLLGLPPMIMGTVMLVTAPVPQLLITGDGRQVAARMDDGTWASLRDMRGDFTRRTLAEAAGVGAPMAAIEGQGNAVCSRDFCRWSMTARDEEMADGRETAPRRWHILAARSDLPVEVDELARACAAADIVIAPRYLPPACRPRWLKADRAMLEGSGGLAIHLDRRQVTASRRGGEHPWRQPPQVSGNDEAIPPDAPGP